MGISIMEGNLVRKNYSDSQTNKGRFERWENVKELWSPKAGNTGRETYSFGRRCRYYRLNTGSLRAGSAENTRHRS